MEDDRVFSEKIHKIKKYLLRVLKPSISAYFQVKNPELFAQWQGNACRQTSFITNYYLKSCLLHNNSGYYDIQSWVGEFEDVINGRSQNYDHAWVYCANINPKKNLLIDLARHHKPCIVVFAETNSFPTNIEGYKHQRCIHKERMNMAEFEMSEYYTKMTGSEIIAELSEVLMESPVQDLAFHNETYMEEVCLT